MFASVGLELEEARGQWQVWDGGMGLRCIERRRPGGREAGREIVREREREREWIDICHVI